VSGSLGWLWVGRGECGGLVGVFYGRVLAAVCVDDVDGVDGWIVWCVCVDGYSSRHAFAFLLLEGSAPRSLLVVEGGVRTPDLSIEKEGALKPCAF